MTDHFDDAIVGAGILGLAHAYHLAKRGRRVLVCERSQQAEGASIRNFGMLWPIGQPPGQMYRLARRSLEIWLEVLRASGVWHHRTGSLHLAYHADEAQVLEEFVRGAAVDGYACEFLDAAGVLARSPAVRPEGLRAGMWSPTETCVDPRTVVSGLPTWLSKSYGVQFKFGCPVTSYTRPHLLGAAGEWTANHLFVCAGDDLCTLFPQWLGRKDMMRCKLQMMRSQPYGDAWRLGPMLAAGLTLRHYQSFQHCPSLPELQQRFDRELPAYGRYGIHVMVSQNGAGESTIGDSHEYHTAIGPFDKPEIDELILRYLDTFFVVPDLRIASRWHGTYVKHPSEPYVVGQPCPGVTLVTGVGGAGMTLSFGLAEQVVQEVLGGN